MTTQHIRPVFRAAGHPVLIGSLPLNSHDTALEWIVGHTPAIPLWPQLPAFAQERMLHQFLEGLPGLCEDLEQDHISFATSGDAFAADQLAFYEDYLAVTEGGGDLLDSRFAISPARAPGIRLLAASLPALAKAVALKGQVTGPFTLLTAIKDRENRLGYYDPAWRDLVVKNIAMKGAWQARFLGAAGLPVLVFIDEPGLAGLGSSAFISIDQKDIIADLDEVAAAIRKAGGLVGVHVCANTDWGLLLSSGIDILSFDAFAFFDRLVACGPELAAFLDHGGILAWGIVPTGNTEDIDKTSAAALAALWERQADSIGGEKTALLAQTLISPSCGTGSLPPQAARRVLELTRDVSQLLRSRYPAG